MRKNKKIIIIVLLMFVVLGMGVGYSILSKQLKIEGSVSLEAEYDVSIVGIEKLEGTTFRNIRAFGYGIPEGTAKENKQPTFTTNTAIFDVTLGLNSSITYLVKIKNTGTVDSVIENIDVAKTGNGINIQTNMNDSLNGNTLLQGDALNYVINISNDGYQELDSNLNSNITITLDTKQKLSSENYSSCNDYLSFGENVLENGEIKGVKLNYLPCHAEINYINQSLYASVNGGEYEEIAVFDGRLDELDLIYNLPEDYVTSGTEYNVKLKMGYSSSDIFTTNEISLLY